MTRRIPTWSEIAKAGDAFDLESYEAMADTAGKDSEDAEKKKIGSKTRVHEGFNSGAKRRFDPERFVPVRNGDDGKLEVGTGFYFTNLGSDGLSDYYHDFSQIYSNEDNTELDRSGVAFTLDPKTHVSFRDANDYMDFLKKYHRFHNYGNEEKPVWRVLPDWEAAAAAGVGSVQFPYDPIKHTEGSEKFAEHWDGPNGERGQPEYIFNHPNEGMVLRPEAVVTQRPYRYFTEKVLHAKDKSTKDRHLAGLTEDGKMFMSWMYGKDRYSPEDIKMWHGYVRRHPEKTLMDLHEVLWDWDGNRLHKSDINTDSHRKGMTEYPEIPSWDQIAKAQTRIDATLNDINQSLPEKNAWDYGQEAAARAAKLRADAQALGNTQMDTQKDYYDRAGMAQNAHDIIPGLVARHAPAVAPEAKAETPAAGTPSNLLQTPIDASDNLDPDIWETASHTKRLLNEAVAHRDAFAANAVEGKEYTALSTRRRSEPPSTA